MKNLDLWEFDTHVRHENGADRAGESDSAPTVAEAK
jgi:hypothetical protein